MSNVRKTYSVKKSYEALRESLWPGLDTSLLWDRKRFRGFASVPKTFPLIMRLIDVLTKGKPAGQTYSALWFNTFDVMLMDVRDEASIALESGFEGPRAVGTWRSRMTSLEQWGFIASKKGQHGPFSHVVIWDPHVVSRRIIETGVYARKDAKRFEKIYVELVRKNSFLRGSFAFDSDDTSWKRLSPSVREANAVDVGSDVQF